MKTIFFYWLNFSKFFTGSIFLGFIFFIRHLEIYNGYGNFEEQKKSIIIFVILLIQILINIKIIKTKHLSQKSHLIILFFALFILIIPLKSFEFSIFIASLILTLLIKNIFDIATPKNRLRDIFYSGLWTIILQLFFFKWAILYFIVIWIIFLLFKVFTLQNILISIIPTFIILIITITLVTYFPNSIDVNWHNIFEIKQFNQENVTHYKILFFLVVLPLSLVFFYSIFNLIGGKQIKEKLLFSLLIFFLIKGTISLFLYAKTNNESIFFIFPMSLFLVKFTEIIPSKKRQTIFLIIFSLIVIYLKINFFVYNKNIINFIF